MTQCELRISSPSYTGKAVTTVTRIIMKSKKYAHSLYLLLTAVIWGIAFVAQSAGGDALGPFAFNSLRNFIGAGVLLPVIFLFDKLKVSGKKPETREDKKRLLTGGLTCGLLLFIAGNVQQVGMYMGTSSGKAGFITACYIVLVPVLSLILFKKKSDIKLVIAVVITLVGLYLLCMSGESGFQFSDLLVLICAFVFSFHILVVDRFSPVVDGVRMSCIQFLTAGTLTLIPAFISDCNASFERVSALFAKLGTAEPWIPLLYAGVLSSGVAYTLQIVGQDGVNPTVASLLMSLESVFAVIGGFFILHETITIRELIGCVLMFAAIILSQLPVSEKADKQTQSHCSD